MHPRTWGKCEPGYEKTVLSSTVLFIIILLLLLDKRTCAVKLGSKSRREIQLDNIYLLAKIYIGTFDLGVFFCCFFYFYEQLVELPFISSRVIMTEELQHMQASSSVENTQLTW